MSNGEYNSGLEHNETAADSDDDVRLDDLAAPTRQRDLGPEEHLAVTCFIVRYSHADAGENSAQGLVVRQVPQRAEHCVCEEIFAALGDVHPIWAQLAVDLR